MKMYRVYGRYNIIERKWYIGCTSQTLEERAGADGCRYCKSKKFYEAIQKYGWSTFISVVFAEYEDKETAYEAEKYFISIMDSIENGYNECEGGLGSPGKGLPRDRAAVRQYDNYGYFVKEFESIAEAAQSVKGSSKKVSECCNHHKKSYRESQWRFKREVGDAERIESLMHNKKSVRCLTADGKLLKVYSCVKEAEKDGFLSSGISSCATGKNELYKGLRFEYCDDTPQVLVDEIPHYEREYRHWTEEEKEFFRQIGKETARDPRENEIWKQKYEVGLIPNALPVRAISLEDGSMIEFCSQAAGAKYLSSLKGKPWNSYSKGIRTAIERSGTAYGFKWEKVGC